MQQKEVLIIIGIVLVGFFLFKQGTFFGQATTNAIISYPQGYQATDAFEEGQTPEPATSSGFICVIQNYPVDCSVARPYQCYAQRPLRTYADSDDVRNNDPDYPILFPPMEAARAQADELCQNQCSAKAARIQYYCQNYCRTIAPDCYPVVGLVNRRPCSSYCGECVTSYNGVCTSSGYEEWQCACVREPISFPHQNHGLRLYLHFSQFNLISTGSHNQPYLNYLENIL